MAADDVPAKRFRVFWNVPSMQCRSKDVLFEGLFDRYGIIQNENDDFNGDKIIIMYDPGMFPAIFEKEGSREYRLRNGGIPQEGDLDTHIEEFRKRMGDIVPNEDFDGIGVIDFESWRPIFRQHWGKMAAYKNLSIDVEKDQHRTWADTEIELEAKRRFEESARVFMETTLYVAKSMRPRAVWGYYGFPYCFNMANDKKERCPDLVLKENDQLSWLWAASTALFPSVYRANDLSPSELAALVRGRVAEAARVRARDAVILPYVWYRYRDGDFLSEADLSAILSTLYKSEASGFIIWGSSSDVNTEEKCRKLLDYVEKVLGPAVASYTKRSGDQPAVSVTQQ